MGPLLSDRPIDAYGVLGVAPDATSQELKAAHRALVRRHHPDLAPPDARAEATRLVQDINVAYGLVRDPQRRAQYDQSIAARTGSMDDLVAAAGVWAGRWWARNRVPLRRGAAVAQTGIRAGGRLARRAAAETIGRVLWLGLCFLGLALGWFVAAALQRITGTSGFLTPLTGALGGLALGNQRGWYLRLRLAGVRVPTEMARLALVVWIAALGAALWLDPRVGQWGP